MLKILKSHENGPLTELSLKTLENGAWINIVGAFPYRYRGQQRHDFDQCPGTA